MVSGGLARACACVCVCGWVAVGGDAVAGRGSGVITSSLRGRGG